MEAFEDICPGTQLESHQHGMTDSGKASLWSRGGETYHMMKERMRLEGGRWHSLEHDFASSVSFSIWGRVGIQKNLLVVFVYILRVCFLVSSWHASSTFNSDSAVHSSRKFLPYQIYNYFRKIYLNLVFQNPLNNFISYDLFMSWNLNTRKKRLEFCCTRLKWNITFA